MRLFAAREWFGPENDIVPICVHTAPSTYAPLAWPSWCLCGYFRLVPSFGTLNTWQSPPDQKKASQGGQQNNPDADWEFRQPRYRRGSNSNCLASSGRYHQWAKKNPHRRPRQFLMREVPSSLEKAGCKAFASLHVSTDVTKATCMVIHMGPASPPVNRDRRSLSAIA